MSRIFWVAVGAVGGVAAYRKGTQVATRARELGPLGSAQAIAAGASAVAGRTANGLGRLVEVRDRRAGKLVVGTAAEAGVPLSQGSSAAPKPIPPDWTQAPHRATGGMGA